MRHAWLYALRRSFFSLFVAWHQVSHCVPETSFLLFILPCLVPHLFSSSTFTISTCPSHPYNQSLHSLYFSHFRLKVFVDMSQFYIDDTVAEFETALNHAYSMAYLSCSNNSQTLPRSSVSFSLFLLAFLVLVLSTCFEVFHFVCYVQQFNFLLQNHNPSLTFLNQTVT